MLWLRISLTGPNTVQALPPSHLKLGNAIAKGNPSVAFDSTTLFYSTTLTGTALPPHAESPLVMDHDSEGW